MAPQILYSAIHQLNKSEGSYFFNYLKNIGLSEIDEVITLDSMHCPKAFEIDDEGWDYTLNEDYMLGLYTNLAYVKARAKDLINILIIGIVKEPDCQLSGKDHFTGAEFIGYDLMDIHMDVSILTNTTGFEQIINFKDLNKFFLIGSFEKVTEIKQRIETEIQDHPHTRGYIFEIWKIAQT